MQNLRPSSVPAASAVPAEERDDAQLVVECRRGDSRAWEQLVRRYQRLIFSIARRARLDADDAADVFQTVFARLHEHLDGLTQPERVRAWLVTTARRETLRLLRDARRSVPLLTSESTDDHDPGAIPELADPDPLPQELLEQLQLQHRMRLARQRLAEPCRSLLDLLYCQDEPPAYAEIAVRLDMPEGSIGPTRSRCLAKLRRLMDDIA